MESVSSRTGKRVQEAPGTRRGTQLANLCPAIPFPSFRRRVKAFRGTSGADVSGTGLRSGPSADSSPLPQRERVGVGEPPRIRPRPVSARGGGGSRSAACPSRLRRRIARGSHGHEVVRRHQPFLHGRHHRCLAPTPLREGARTRGRYARCYPPPPRHPVARRERPASPPHPRRGRASRMRQRRAWLNAPPEAATGLSLPLLSRGSHRPDCLEPNPSCRAASRQPVASCSQRAASLMAGNERHGVRPSSGRPARCRT